MSVNLEGFEALDQPWGDGAKESWGAGYWKGQRALGCQKSKPHGKGGVGGHYYA